MRETKGNVYIGSVFFVALTFIISLLISNLSGMSEYTRNAMTAYSESYREIGEVVNELGTGEEALERVQEIIAEASERIYVWPEVEIFPVVLSVALALLLLLLRAGYVSHCMLVSRRESVTVRDMFNSFGCTGKMLIIIILRGLAVALGLICLIVPGLIALYCYRLSIYVAYDNPELGAVACMRKARQLVKGRKWQLLKLDISFIGWWIGSLIVSSFTLPILDIWTKPYFGVTVAQWYNNVSGYGAQAVDDAVPQE